MSRRQTRPRPLSPNPQPLKEEKRERPSSEIDLDEVLKLAREADEQAKAEPEPAKKKRVKAEPTNGQAAPEVVVIEPDPEFVSMCQWGVGAGVDFMKLRLDWSDPGIHWKEKVAFIAARIVQRIQPMQPSLTTDLITIGGYAALWALPNVTAQRAIKRTAKNQNLVGNDGERKDAQAPGTPGAGG